MFGINGLTRANPEASRDDDLFVKWPTTIKIEEPSVAQLLFTELREAGEKLRTAAAAVDTTRDAWIKSGDDEGDAQREYDASLKDLNYSLSGTYGNPGQAHDLFETLNRAANELREAHAETERTAKAWDKATEERAAAREDYREARYALDRELVGNDGEASRLGGWS